MKKQYLVPGAALLMLAAFAIAAFLYNSQKTQEISARAQQNVSVLERDYSPTSGSKTAKVTIVEFFDPACETCRAFHPFVKQIMDANPGKIRLVMRYTPFHDGSDMVVKILEAARLQDKFWETLDATYAAQPVWASHGNSQPEKLWMRLGGAGLNLKQIRTDMDHPFIGDRMRQDMADARQLQVTKTPSFFVNGKPLVRFGYETLQALIESELNKHY